MKWFIKCFKQYADFKGRARRREYWWFTLINFIVVFILMMCITIPMIGAMASDPEFLEMAGSSDFDAQAYADSIELDMYKSMTHSPFFYIYAIYALAILLPGLAVTVRRLHDTGRSGWWALLVLGGYLYSLSNFIGMGAGAKILISLIGIASCITLLVFMFIDSQEGENKWGPNPKEPDWNDVTDVKPAE